MTMHPPRDANRSLQSVTGFEGRNGNRRRVKQEGSVRPSRIFYHRKGKDEKITAVYSFLSLEIYLPFESSPTKQVSSASRCRCTVDAGGRRRDTLVHGFVSRFLAFRQ